MHEDLAKEMAETPGFEKRLLDQVFAEDWDTQNEEHPVVQAQPAGQFAVPLALYVEGVPVQRSDSVTGYWLVLLTGRRHLFLTMRKKHMCRCGCAVNYLDIHQVDAIHTGRYPRQVHTMEPWHASDRQLVLAGLTWAEFAVTFGVQTWAHHANPCFLCDASGGPDGTWRETEGVSMFSSLWHANDDLQVLLEHVHTRQRRERGGQTLPLSVESSSTCWSSLMFEGFAGVHITLWNPSAETLARHRNTSSAMSGARLKAWVCKSPMQMEACGQWYKKEKAARTRLIYEMPDFSIKNLGSTDSRELETKAAESGTLLFFAIDMIEKHKARMSNPTPLLQAGKALREYMDITRSQGLRLPRFLKYLLGKWVPSGFAITVRLNWRSLACYFRTRSRAREK